MRLWVVGGDGDETTSMLFPQFSTDMLCQVILAAPHVFTHISADAITSIISSILYQRERQVANTQSAQTYFY